MKPRVITAVTSFCVLATLAIGYGSYRHQEHIRWYFNPLRAAAIRISVTPMRIAQPSRKSYRFKLGSISFAAPNPFCSDAPFRVSKEMKGAVELAGDSTRVVIYLPQDNREFAKEFHASLPPKLSSLNGSILSIRAAAYAASGDDFKWSMTSDELALHQDLVLRKFPPATFIGRVETFTADDGLQGELKVIGDNAAEYEWYSSDEQVRGLLYFSPNQTDAKLDLESVRAVCASLETTGRVYEFPMSDGQLQTIVDRANRLQQ